MDLHPDIPSAAAHVRQVYELGVRYFDCARMYWNGQSEEAYGLGLQGWDASWQFQSQSARRLFSDRAGWPPWGVWEADTPTQLGQFPALAAGGPCRAGRAFRPTVD